MVGRAARALVVLTLTVAYFAYVFQLAQGTWLTTGLGDWVDPYFINGLLEQWTYSVWHLSDPASPPMFHPAPGTLGGSHGLILYAPFYVAVRPWLHPFAAHTLTVFLVMQIGALSLYAIFRRFLALDFLESLILTAAFCTSLNVINGAMAPWSQRASVFLIPPIVLLGLHSAKMEDGSRKLLGYLLTALLATLLPTQDFNTGFLTFVVFGLLLLGGRLILRWPSPGMRVWITRTLPPLHGRVRRVATWSVLLLIVIAALWVWVSINGRLGIPWFDVESHHHHWERPGAAALALLVVWLCLRGGIRTRLHLTIRPENLPATVAIVTGALMGLAVFIRIYLGPFLEHRGFSADELRNSLAVGVLPYDSARSFLFVLGVSLLVWLPWFRVPRRAQLCSLWFLMVSAFVLLVSMQLDGYALWSTLAQWVPGFSAVRDPKRIIYIYELAVVLSTGLLLAQLPRRSVFRLLIAGALLGLVIAEPNRTTLDYRRPMDVFNRYVEAPISVDPSCRSFFVKGASEAYMSRTDNKWSLYANDAIFVAVKHAVPTLNGYSVFGPRHWGLANPQNHDYPDAVAQWVRLHGLQGVCALDIEAHSMTPYHLPPARQ